LPPVKYDKAQFISHQFNAYEVSENILVADMITYDDSVYKAMFVDNFIGAPTESAHAIRFTLNLKEKTASASTLVPQDPADIEFSQFNHNFEGKPYKYGYVITSWYRAGNAIMKIDMTDPSGAKNKIFQPRNSESMSLLEPWFVQEPGTNGEDDGVIVARAFDTSINKARVYTVDAKTMEQVGEILAPTDIPFGFHERFYLKSSFDKKKNDNNAHVEL